MACVWNSIWRIFGSNSMLYWKGKGKAKAKENATSWPGILPMDHSFGCFLHHFGNVSRVYLKVIQITFFYVLKIVMFNMNKPQYIYLFIFIEFGSVGCGVVIGGSTRFDKEAKNVVKIIIETANGASNTIQNTTSAMKDMISNLEASKTTGSYRIQETSGTLTSTSHNLDAQAANIQWQANKNRLLIHKGLNIV